MTPEEVAAVTAVAVALHRREAQAAAAAPDGPPVRQPSAWVDASRRAAQRALLQRGPWRLSGRIGRRSRA